MTCKKGMNELVTLSVDYKTTVSMKNDARCNLEKGVVMAYTHRVNARNDYARLGGRN
jgi:hypothetical protein